MKSSRASENSGAIGLFPFLAVLLCTMGALLVLLVVFAEAAKRTAVAARNRDEAAAQPAADVDDLSSEDAAALAKHLKLIRDRMASLAKVRREAEQRLQQEQARLSHLEEHARRVEHQLAQLHVVHQQLKAAEQDLTVDGEQAQRELQRLQQLVDETREQLEQQRQKAGKKSYAILPYKGANGTERRPIYVECTAEGVVIQPEGVVLTEQDFAGPRRPGNPLASAMRAAREHLNARAAAGGQQTPPDPYPLLIVRPGGGDFYNAAMRAIRDWDADFGYEFVEANANLEYSMIDPQLGQSMQHAVEQARQRQRLLAEIAPSRYGSLAGKFAPAPATNSGSGLGNGVGGRSDRYGGDAEFGSGAGQGDGAATLGGVEGDEVFAAGNRSSTNGSAASQVGGRSGGAAPGGEQQGGPPATGATDAAGNDAPANFAGPGGDGFGGPASSSGPSDAADQYAGTGTGGDSSGSGQSAGSSQGSGGQSQNAAGAAAAGGGGNMANALGGAAANQAASGAAGQIGGPVASGSAINDASQGIDWSARLSNREAVAVRRPIRAAVYADRVALLASRHSPGATGSPTGAVIMLNQPTQRVAAELIEALQEHVEQWGLAGQDLYWRPELVLTVAAGGEGNAATLSQLLQSRGVDVRPLESAARSTEGDRHGAR